MISEALIVVVVIVLLLLFKTINQKGKENGKRDNS